MSGHYSERDAQRVIVLRSDDGGTTWVPDVTGLGGASVLSYGATGDGVTDDTAAIQSALDSLSGKTVQFPKGTFLVSSGLTVHAGTTLSFDDATIKINATIGAGLFQMAAVDISVEGKLTVDFNSKATPCFVGTSGANRFTADVHVIAKNANSTPGANNYLFKFLQCSYVKIGGHITTTGNAPWLVFCDRCYSVEVYGVDTPAITVNTDAYPMIWVTDTTNSNGAAGCDIHDCHIDGGGVIAYFAPIFVGTVGSNVAITDVRVSNCYVKNTTSLADGVDIICANYVNVVNCNFDTVQWGVGIAGGAIINVVGCNSANNRGPSVGVGDNLTPMDTNRVTVSNCQAWNCGTDAGAVPYSFWINTGTNKNTATVRFTDCFAGAPAGQYAFGINKTGSGTVTDVEITGGEYSAGSVGVLRDLVGSATNWTAVVRNARGLNPGGIRTSPAFPASNVAITNALGYDCTVIVYTGVGVTVSDVKIGGQSSTIACAASSQTVPIRIPARQTIAVVYAGGTPAWGWFGD